MKKILLVFSAAGFSFLTNAQVGVLDNSFGNNGFNYTNIRDITAGNERANAAVQQADGKLLVAGNAGSLAMIFRYNADGTPDNSFGNNGQVFIAGYDVISAMALQANGKIVLTSSTGLGPTRDFTLIRLNTDGLPDSSFDNDGKVTTDFNNAYDLARAVVIQPDGKIIAAGYTTVGSYNQFGIVRYNSDGSLDNSFDGDGKVTTVIGTLTDEATTMALQPDGKIVVGGQSYTSHWNFSIARYNTDGSLDNSFDGDGKKLVDFGNFSYAASVALQTDGKIVLAGRTTVLTQDNFAIVRFNADGSFDNGFDGDGILTTDFSGFSDGIWAVKSDGNGKIIAVGQSSNGTSYSFALARYNSDGSLDNSFDGDGRLTTAFGTTQDFAFGLIVQNDDNIIAAGSSFIDGGQHVAVAKYLGSNGSLDNSFDGDGKLVTAIISSRDVATTLLLRGGGKLLVAGSSGDNTGHYYVGLVGYNANGTIDNAFGTDGKVTTNINAFDFANTGIVQPDGKIVIGGYTNNGGNKSFLIRYNADGTLDNSFDGDGILVSLIAGTASKINSMAIQPDGKIVVAGNSYNGTNLDFLVARFNSDGTPDNSFDGDGVAVTAIGSGDDEANAVVIQNDGSIVAGGYSRAGSNTVFAVARYHSDGSPDNTFDDDGKLTTVMSAIFSAIRSLAIQGDGKIVAGGYAIDGYTKFALARYKTDGSLDDGFDADGKVTTAIGIADGYIQSVAIQNDGRIVTAGRETGVVNGNIAIVRYNQDGTQDNTFAGDGLADDDLLQVDETGMAMVLDHFRIYVAGSGLTQRAEDFIVAAYLNDGVPLPLSWLGFSGWLQNDDVVLTWKTEDEENTKSFVVERSIDGSQYNTEGIVDAANTAGINIYRFTDLQAGKLNATAIHYRLKQVDIDGRFSYSKIITVVPGNNQNLVQLLGNPVKNNVTLSVIFREQEKIAWQLFDHNGKKIKQGNNVIAAGQSTMTISIDAVSTGIYYLELKGNNLDKVITLLKE